MSVSKEGTVLQHLRKITGAELDEENLAEHAPESSVEATGSPIEAFVAEDRRIDFVDRMKREAGNHGLLDGTFLGFANSVRGFVQRGLKLMDLPSTAIKTTWEDFTKDIVLLGVARKPNEITIAQSPIVSMSRFSKSAGGGRNLHHSIWVINPRFFDQEHNLLEFTDLPPEYVEAVANTFIVSRYFRCFSGDIQTAFRNISEEKLRKAILQKLEVKTNEWENNPPIPVEKLFTQEFFQWLLLIGAFHEYWHGMGLHMPDNLEARKNEDKNLLDQYSITTWEKLWEADPKLNNSTIDAVDTIKALLDSEVVLLGTGEFVEQWHHLENQANRASIYMLESVLKITSVQTLLKLDEGTSFIESQKIIDFVYELDDARRLGKLPELLMTERMARILTTAGTTPEVFASDVKTRFEQAENVHPYISFLKDPALTPAERQYFRPAFDHLRFYDGKNKFGRLDAAHLKTSRFIRVTLAYLGVKALGNVTH